MIDLDALFPYARFDYIDDGTLKVRTKIRVLLDSSGDPSAFASELADVTALFGVELESFKMSHSVEFSYELSYTVEELCETIAIIAWLSRHGRKHFNTFSFLEVPA
ncbi:MAG: hypothetical protein GY833_22665 [Aestuariibacter sp.]|nr:hypothetical protein [Aestuariibacter sp.]|tara:strand:- start:232489 stop:232806 length:318 start_codon:yes stop_codon:yes gene_type:complete